MNSTIILNLRGIKYEVLIEKLLKYPETRLGKLAKYLVKKNTNEIVTLCDKYNLELNEFYFDKDPYVLNTFLSLYHSGSIYLNTDYCSLLIKNELGYWNINESFIEPCCHIIFSEKLDECDDINHSLIFIKEEKFNNNYKYKFWPVLRKSLWDLLDNPTSSLLAKILFIFSMLVVMISVNVMIIQTIPELQVYLLKKFSLDPATPVNCALDSTQLFCFIWSVFEICIRFFACPNKIQFIKSISNITDVVCLLPFIIWLSTEELNIFSVLKIFILLKISRYNNGLKLFGRTILISLKELGVLLMLLFIGMILFSTIVFLCELSEPNTEFKSIPSTFWWSIITMTTVGYGDIVPETIAGKIFGAVCALSGLVFLALPIGIIASNFSKVIDKDKKIKRLEKLEEKSHLIVSSNRFIKF